MITLILLLIPWTGALADQCDPNLRWLAVVSRHAPVIRFARIVVKVFDLNPIGVIYGLYENSNFIHVLSVLCLSFYALTMSRKLQSMSRGYP